MYLQACDTRISSNTLENFAILFVFNISEIDINTHKLLFEDVRVKDGPKQIEFMAISIITMGKKKFDCTHGVKRNRSLKKKILVEKVERDIYETTLVCIYIYIYIFIYIYII